MRLKASFILPFVLGAVFARLGVTQPIAPTEDLKSQTTTTPALDLPYKPEEPISTPPTADMPEDPAAIAAEAMKPVFDWNNLPYIPLKMPALKSLPDPDF